MPHITAFRAIRLFDGTSVIDDPVVVVEDGRVTAVERGPHAPVPPDAEVVDLGGATLIPGLVDCHVHLAFDGGIDPVATLAARDADALLDAMAAAAAAQLRAGVTTVRDLGDRSYSALALRDSDRGPLPTIVAAGPPITSPRGHCHFLGGEATGTAGLRAAVREHAERGVDVIKVMASGGMMTEGTDIAGPQFSAGELAALVAEAHCLGLPVTAHAHALAAVEDAVSAGVDGIEHCSFVTPNGVRAPERLLAALVRTQTAIGMTVGIAPTDPPMSPPPELMRLLPDILAAHATLIRDGALVVPGCDDGIAPIKPHGVLPHGLAQLVELGMSPETALHAATRRAATVCGVGDRKGRVAPGFDADLVAFAGDPTKDIAALRDPLLVVMGGQALERATVAT